MRNLKLTLYWIARACGVFSLARQLTRDKLRILCYHGVSKGELDKWRPMLFMTSSTFAARLNRLKELGYPVLPLDEAVRKLPEGTLPPNATVITIDDGFKLTNSDFVPLLSARKLPATIYVTSYYAEKAQPIFELVVQYLLFIADQNETPIEDQLREALSLHEEVGKNQMLAKFADLEIAKKKSICETLCAALKVNAEDIWGSGEFTLMSPREISAASNTEGISIQLHTRRHRFPTEPELANTEIDENRRDLEPFVTGPLKHFCYPSGIWCEDHFNVLATQGIRSATTTDNGLNSPDANLLALTRYLDSETLSMLEFEAELSGFAHILRGMFHR